MTRNKQMAMEILKMMAGDMGTELLYDQQLDEVCFMRFDDDFRRKEMFIIRGYHSNDEAVRNFIKIKNIIKELKNAK